MRVLIGCPSGDMRYGSMDDCKDAMVWHTKRVMPGIELGWKPRQSSVPSQNQNKVFWEALEEGADYVMLIDSDMMFPPDALIRLLNHGLSFVAGVYRFRGPPFGIAAAPLDGTRLAKTGIVSMAHVASGFILVRRDVLNAVGYPWMEEVYGNSPAELVGHDVQFCRKVREAGFDVYADMDLSARIYHLGVLPIGLEGVVYDDK